MRALGTEDRKNGRDGGSGAALQADGRVYAGTTVYDGEVALRPAIVNWRITDPDIDLLVTVVRELTANLVTEMS